MKCILPLAILWFSLEFPQPNVPQQAKVVTAAQVNGTWQSRFGKSRSGSTIKILAHFRAIGGTGGLFIS